MFSFVRIFHRTSLKERLRVRMFYSLLVVFKQVRDGTDVPKDDSGLFEPAATSPAGSPTTSRQVSFRGAVGTADTMVSGRHSRLRAHALANAGASAKCNEAVVAQAATPGIGAILDEAADHPFKAWACF
jgi:hypothetical protein